MKSFLVVVLASFSTVIHAQIITPNAVYYPGNSIDNNPDLFNYAATIDQAGDVVACGFDSNVSFYNVAQGNLFLKKITASGSVTFSKVLQGNIHPYQLVTDGTNFYLSVSYLTNLQFDSLVLTAPSQQEHPVVIKIDANGNYVWHKTIGDVPGFSCNALTATADGSVYVGYDNFTTSFLEKLNADGTSAFVMTQNQAKEISSIAVDANGNIAVAGSCAGSVVDFNGTVQNNKLLYNSYIAYYNVQRELQWAQFVPDITCVDPTVVFDQEGNIYFASQLPDNFTVIGQSTEGPGNAFYDFFLCKINPAGQLQWLREVPGNGEFRLPTRKYLVTDQQNRIYLTGAFRGNVQWNEQISSSTGNLYDLAILIYSSDGNLLQAQTGGSFSTYDSMRNIAVNESGRGVISGISAGNGQFGTITMNPGTASFRPFVIDFNVSTLSTNEGSSKVDFSFFPNPAQNNFTILLSYAGDGNLRVTDVMGKTLLTSSFHETQLTLDCSSYPDGVYFVTFTKNNQSSTKKLVVKHN
jgi:hypothetical protein